MKTGIDEKTFNIGYKVGFIKNSVVFSKGSLL